MLKLALFVVGRLEEMQLCAQLGPQDFSCQPTSTAPAPRLATLLLAPLGSQALSPTQAVRNLVVLCSMHFGGTLGVLSNFSVSLAAGFRACILRINIRGASLLSCCLHVNVTRTSLLPCMPGADPYAHSEFLSRLLWSLHLQGGKRKV